jgi:hypothetical protein
MGHELEFEMPLPTKVLNSSELFDLSKSRQCTCAYFTCVRIPDEANVLVARAQWDRIVKRKASRRGYTDDCVKVR